MLNRSPYIDQPDLRAHSEQFKQLKYIANLYINHYTKYTSFSYRRQGFIGIFLPLSYLHPTQPLSIYFFRMGHLSHPFSEHFCYLITKEQHVFSLDSKQLLR